MMLYNYNARWYDASLARFIQADTIVPNPGNPASLNRYAYVLNNPLRFVDPTGHFTQEEICTYWGYCDEEAARKGLGDLFDMLWDTAITWGDLLFLGDENGVTTTAMFVLMSDGEENYSAGLWNLGGQPVQWSTAKSASHKAAYHATENIWEGMTRSEALKWVGKIPAVKGAASLALAEGMGDYQIATYVDLNGLWLAAAGITVAAWFPEALAAVGVGATAVKILQLGSIAVDMAGLIDDINNLDLLPGPVDATYPAIYVDPLHIGRSPSQRHISPPGGKR